MEILADGRIVVAGQRQFLAGSGADTGQCVVKPCGMRESPYRKPSIWPAATRPGCLGSRKFVCDAERGPI